MERPQTSHDRAVELLSALDARDCLPLDPSRAVWRLHTPGLLSGSARRRMVEATKVALLELVRDSLQPAFIFHPDSPLSEGVPAAWTTSVDGGWRFPADLCVHEESARYWLFHLGNWTVIAASGAAASSWPDPFKTSPAVLLHSLRALGIRLLISSFHDDTDWIIALVDS